MNRLRHAIMLGLVFLIAAAVPSIRARAAAQDRGERSEQQGPGRQGGGGRDGRGRGVAAWVQRIQICRRAPSPPAQRWLIPR